MRSAVYETRDGCALVEVGRRVVGKALGATGPTELADRRIRHLSGGMRQRVGIAQALLTDPDIFIVDEPTVGLDPEERLRFRNLLAGLAGERIVILSTHIVEDVAQSCRDVAVLAHGQVQFAGLIEEMLRQADGYVWETEWSTSRPLPAGWKVTSTVAQGQQACYRFVAAPAAVQSVDGVQVKAAAPTLEEAYVCLLARPGMASQAQKSLPKRAVRSQFEQ